MFRASLVVSKLFTLASLFFSLHAYAFTFSPLISDHMVIQRDHPIKISGTGSVNDVISVRFMGQPQTVTVDEQGKWLVAFKQQAAGGPYKLHARSSQGQIKIVKDIYIGDVWLASGQSNMEWKLKWNVDNWQAEVADSHFPLIRYYDVPNRYLSQEQSTLPNGKWKLASPATVSNFSAVAWFVAKRLYKQHKVPIAIIDSTWGGTPAEAWTPLATLSTLPFYKTQADDLLQNPEKWDQTFVQNRKANNEKEQLLNSQIGHTKLGLSSIDYDDTHWPTVTLPNKEHFKDITWLRKSVYLSKELSLNDAILSLGRYPQFIQVYVNGEFVGAKKGEDKENPFFIPSNNLRVGSNLIALRILNAWNNRSLIGKEKKMVLSVGSEIIRLDTHWRVNSNVEGRLPMPVKYWQKEGALYNAMIHPLIQYPLKGVIWYQGESNTKDYGQYEQLFKSMISAWRNRWDQPTLPFVFAQLANIRATNTLPVEHSDWAELRFAQTKALALKNTAMSVLIDAGEAWDIHPRNKQIVGQRMWHAAEAIAYGSNQIYSGPMATKLSLLGNKLKIEFKDIGKGLMIKGTQLLGFELAGADGKYVSATASVVDNTVILSTPFIAMPVSVRYGWADNPKANLYNKNGFPAIPFKLSR